MRIRVFSRTADDKDLNEELKERWNDPAAAAFSTYLVLEYLSIRRNAGKDP